VELSSGCDHASWVLLGGILVDGDGKPVDFRTFLLPVGDYVIDDVWDTVGLRGTGSNDIVVDGALVPRAPVAELHRRHPVRLPGQQRNPGPLYRIPYGSVFSNAITTPIIGMATGAYAAHVAYSVIGCGPRTWVRSGRGRVRPGADRRGGGPA